MKKPLTEEQKLQRIQIEKDWTELQAALRKDMRISRRIVKGRIFNLLDCVCEVLEVGEKVFLISMDNTANPFNVEKENRGVSYATMERILREADYLAEGDDHFSEDLLLETQQTVRYADKDEAIKAFRFLNK